jgi:hypothetical protein
VLNAHVNEDCTEITLRADHNISVAMDTPAGLVVPNIKVRLLSGASVHLKGGGANRGGPMTPPSTLPHARVAGSPKALASRNRRRAEPPAGESCHACMAASSGFLVIFILIIIIIIIIITSIIIIIIMCHVLSR